MYNRYVPQPDGSFRRTRLPDRSRPIPPEAPQACPPPPPEPCPAPEPGSPPKPKPEPCSPPKPEPRPCRPAQGSIGGFFRQLLPRDMDTGDLLIILLLLLMAGDCTEDQNTALLTLVLYLFM